MSSKPGKPGKPGRKKGMGKSKRRALAKEKHREEDEEIERLTSLVTEQAPARGVNPLAALLQKEKAQGKKGKKEDEDDEVETEEDPLVKSNVTSLKYEDLPISRKTKSGLKSVNWTRLTHIQAASLPHALIGRDILGAAKTGSGKTLCFVIPVLERLFLNSWTKFDGLGGAIISPTRELSLQTFEVVRKAGCRHPFSAGLVIGGKDVKEEKSRICDMNILVATPGRFLHHLDQTPNFDVSQLQILVLDEADRILDLGFSNTMKAILEHLPQERQTLLFSATQSRSVRQLANLSLKDPEYISVHEKSAESTPTKLKQNVMIVPLGKKLDVLFSFVRAHLKSKILVFGACCKEVAFFYKVFCKLRPGLPVMVLHGNMKQMKRMAVFLHFSQSPSALCFATDVAARGLDIVGVDWVVQFDCPDDAETYIHRVGRTARFESGGNGVLFLEPSEIEMVKVLHSKKVPVQVVEMNATKEQTITPRLQSLLAQKKDLQEDAKRMIKAYVRCMQLKSNKDVFRPDALPLEDFSASLGLNAMPKLKGMTNTVMRNRREGSELTKLKEEIRREHLAKKGIIVPEKKQEEDSSEGETIDFLQSDSEEDEEDEGGEGGLLLKESKGKREEEEVTEKEMRIMASKVSNRTMKKIREGAVIKPMGTRVVFDDSGESLSQLESAFLPKAKVTEGMGDSDEEEEGGKKRKRGENWLEDVKEEMKGADEEDRETYKKLLKEKRLKRRKLEAEENEQEERVVVLGAPSDGSEDESDDESDDESEEEERGKGRGRKQESDSEDEESDEESEEESDEESEEESEEGGDLEQKALDILKKRGFAMG